MAKQTEQRHLRTEDQEENWIPAGTISQEGIQFVFLGTSVMEGKYENEDGNKTFTVIKGLTPEGREILIPVSSKRLLRMITENYEVLINQTITLCGSGSNYDRHYEIIF